MEPTLYQISTVDIPQTENVEILTFADDTAITAVHCELNRARQILQKGLNEIGSWTQTWRIKMNASKSTHMIFTTWNVAKTQIVINNESIPITNKMTLKARVTVNRKQMVPNLQKINWLLSYKSALTLNNKILL